MTGRQVARTDLRGDHDNHQEKSLNFKVSSEFKKEFKGFAVSQGMSMTSLLKEGFLLSKRKRQK